MARGLVHVPVAIECPDTLWLSELAVQLAVDEPAVRRIGANNQRWVIAIFEKNSITKYIANYFDTEWFALAIEVIGLKKPIFNY